MSFSPSRAAIHDRRKPGGYPRHHCIKPILSLLLVFVFISLELGRYIIPQANAQLASFDHTMPTVDATCTQAFYSPDGNPFQLCPGPYPGGGNCVWWAWEQWHLLGYNLPLNWGNAADWIVDAERTGLPLDTTPRVGSIAVFPVADGVWAFGAAGHVAFVTWVSPDGRTFNVTYQDYGDPTPMFVGRGYPVSVINEPRYQDGQLRFISFPLSIDPARFARLPGVDGTGVAEVLQGNRLLATGSTPTLTTSQLTLGLPQGSPEQEYTADFTGSGLSDLVLYNRSQGRLDILKMPDTTRPPLHVPLLVSTELAADPSPQLSPQRVSLADATTPVNGWGSTLDIHVGDFAGTGQSALLLYDRLSGQIQLISLTPQLTIKQHLIVPGWGPGWEVYVGRFDGQRSALFLYNRSLNAPPVSTPTATPSPAPGQIPTPTPSPTPGLSPSPSPTPSPSPGPSPSPTPGPSPTVSPTPSPIPSATPSPTTSPSPSPTPTPSPSPSPTPTPSPSPSPSPSPTPGPSPTAGPRLNTRLDPALSPSPTPGGGGLSGSTADGSAAGTPPAKANVLVLDFTQELHLRQVQSYTLAQNSWEVYVGHFVGPRHDGVFLYDRTAGEARMISFTPTLRLAHQQELHNLSGNWEVSSADVSGSGQAQVVLYDPRSGDGQILTFSPDLSLAAQKSYAGWRSNQVLYTGHFGRPTLSLMLYDPAAHQSTFLAFDASLQLTQHVTVQSWDQHWQILVGAFLDRSRCLARGNCTAGDDILVLDRQTGHMQHYVFSFGNQFTVYDNRVQAFLREGEGAAQHLVSVDTSTFSLLATLETTIQQEELY